MNDIESATAQLVERNEQLDKIFIEVYEANSSDAAYNSVALAAVDCAKRLYTILESLRKPTIGLHRTAVLDLMVGLHGSTFTFTARCCSGSNRLRYTAG
jgi:hypothetical protein